MEEKVCTAREQMNAWAELMSAHKLPAWAELPDLELYMDQVVSLVSQYLGYMGPILGEEKPVTPAMINNYVKMGLLKAPVKKRYNRGHLACLVMICILKRALNMSAIQKLMPREMTLEEIAALYESFRISRSQSIDCVAARIRSWDGEVFRDDGGEDDKALMMRLAIMANLFKISAEKLVGAPTEDGKK